MSSGEAEKFSLDSILVQIGQFGAYQLKNYVLLSLPMMFNAIFSMSYLFAAGSLTYRCNITECDSPTSSFYEPWTNYTIPMDSNGEDRRCMRYESNNNSSNLCLARDFNNHKLEKCGQFKFMDRETSISKEVCFAWYLIVVS